jgi:tRNA nucleotidyltransferase (CCA-adding enzyme)
MRVTRAAAGGGGARAERRCELARLDTRQLLAALTPANEALVERLLERAAASGIQVYAVGGPVRDLLLHRPVRDLDLLVEAEHAAAIERVLRRLAGRELELVKHERFGTFELRGPEVELDLAIARREAYAHPGALPSVEPATLAEDLERRDFRVNALALPLALVDDPARAPVEAVAGALADLRESRLAVLHRRSFHDDPTRALRAARLCPRLGFKLARGTRSALADAMRDGAFGAVSGDRFRREFEKLFAEATLGLDPAAALRLLADWHVLGALEPGLEMPRAVSTPLRRLGRSIADPPWRLARHRPWVAGLALWLAELQPMLRKRALERLSVRGETAARIGGFRKLRDRAVQKLTRSRGRGAVDAVLGELDEDQVLALHSFAEPALRRRIVRWAAEDRGRRPSVNGTDLVALGLEGAAVGRVLALVRTAYLDGALANREEALALARELARRAGPAEKATGRARSEPQ